MSQQTPNSCFKGSQLGDGEGDLEGAGEPELELELEPEPELELELELEDPLEGGGGLLDPLPHCAL
jgi:hypothetical protein